MALSNEFVNSLSDEIIFSLNNIVLTLIQLHADAQNEFIELCVRSQRNIETKLSRSAGLLFHLDLKVHSEEFSDENLIHFKRSLHTMSKYAQFPDLEQYSKIMILAYDLLEWLLLNSPENIRLACTKLDPFSTNEKTIFSETISSYNEKFFLDFLLQRFYDEYYNGGAVGDVMEELQRFLILAARYPPDEIEEDLDNASLKSDKFRKLSSVKKGLQHLKLAFSAHQSCF